MSLLTSIHTFGPVAVIVCLAFVVAELNRVLPRQRGAALERWRILLVGAILAAAVVAGANVVGEW